MSSMFQKASDSLKGKADSHDDGASLTTVLDTIEHRRALTLLIYDISELMRRQIVDTFDADETGAQKPDSSVGFADEPNETDETDETGGSAADDVERDSGKEKEERARKERMREVNEKSMVELKKAALEFFDDWRDSVILRIGEVVNSRTDQPQHSTPTNSKSDEPSASPGVEVDDHEARIDERLREIYVPVETPLRTLDESKRALVLHSLILLMLSLKHYNAHSRTLLLYCTTSLGLSVKILSADEGKVAKGLLSAANHMSADEETQQRAEKNSMARKWKMGAAGVAGAALIGITGGLAAPFLAAGLGTALGGIGLGATATAGYLGALAGSGVLVGGLFGAYGARMSAQAMERYTRDVQDFAFVPIHKPGMEAGDTPPQSLRMVIGISGWLGDEDEIIQPWRVFDQGLDAFALRFEVEALKSLGNSLNALITSLAWKFAKREIIKRTVFAALMAGLWPITLTNAGRIIDNPWSVANQRAQKAGEVLADVLINKAQGERPVTLVGYSLGARVIYICLQQLAKRKGFGLVENVVLLGAPTPSSSAEWRRIRSVVTGRVVNAYSTRDYVLGFLYRTNSVQLGVAGLSPVLNVKGVENIDISDLVEGHTLYKHATGPTLGRLGFEDTNLDELKREEIRLEKQEQEEQRQREEAAVREGEDGQERLADEVHEAHEDGKAQMGSAV
ncbi:DUF726-domain-containing protein [Poronia punctata]|nr:DUF726-domain-containing protein [Poronia punctata]